MSGEDRHDVFLAFHFSAGCGGRDRRRWSRGASLAAGVAVDFVVVADVDHVLVALRRGGERGHSDVERAAITENLDTADMFADEELTVFDREVEATKAWLESPRFKGLRRLYTTAVAALALSL